MSLVNAVKIVLLALAYWGYSGFAQDASISIKEADSLKPRAQAGVSVTDFRGRKVTLAKPAKRIIALAPHIVENVYSAGAGDYLVAVVNHSDFPEAAKTLPIVGGYNSFSLEKIVSLSPDLVIAWQSGNKPSVLSQIEKLGIPIYVGEPRVLEDVSRSIKDIAILAGTEHRSRELLAFFDEKVELLRAKQNSQSKIKVSVLYQVWDSPLQTLNGQHIISDVIRICGGVNAYSDAVSIAPKISIESVLQKDPDIIVTSGMGEARPYWLDKWKNWPLLSAVKNGHLYFIPPDLIQRHTSRLLKGTLMMCEFIEQAKEV